MKLIRNNRHWCWLLCSALVLAGCSSKDDEPVLPEIENKVHSTEVWSQSVGAGIEHFDSQLSPMLVGDKVFAASRAGIVAAYDAASGDELWQIDLRDGNDAPLFGGLSHWWNERNAIVSGGVGFGYDKVLVGTENGDVYALDPATGALIWTVKVQGEVLAAPVAGEGYILVNTGAGRLFALQPDTGEQRWMHESENSILTLRGISKPVAAGGGILFGTGNGKIGVLVADKGVPAWEEPIAVAKGATDLARIIDVDATPIVQNGIIYAIAYNGELVALDLRTGRTIWKREFASYRDMTLDGDTLYVVDSVGKMYALETRSGTELWSQPVLHRFMVTGPAVYKNYVVVGDVEGNLHWFDKVKGTYLAREEFDSSGFYTEAVTNSDYLLLQSRNGELTMLNVTE